MKYRLLVIFLLSAYSMLYCQNSPNFTHIISNQNYNPELPLSGWLQPSESINGDKITVRFVDGAVVHYFYDGSNWNFNYITPAALRNNLLTSGLFGERGNVNPGGNQAADNTRNIYNWLGSNFKEHWQTSEDFEIFSITNNIVNSSNTLYHGKGSINIGLPGLDNRYKLNIGGTIWLDNGRGSQFIGNNAGFNSSIFNSVSIGNSSGYESSSENGVNIGSHSGFSSNGINSINIGNMAGQSTNGSNTINLGFQAGKNNLTQNSINIGSESGLNNIGLNSINIGTNTGLNNSGNFAINIGDHSGTNNSSNFSINIGYEAGLNMTSGSDPNINIGLRAGKNQEGNANINIGQDSGQNITATGSANINIGKEAGYSANSNYMINFGIQAGRNAINSNDAIFIGDQSGFNANGAVDNIGIGRLTLMDCQAQENLAIGKAALKNNTTGFENVALGNESGFGNVSGQRNTYLGWRAGFQNNGTANVLVGESANDQALLANENTGVGARVMHDNGHGSRNVAIGTSALHFLQTFQAIDMIAGNQYQIFGIGNPSTDFVSLGAENNEVLTIFTYNGNTVTGDGRVRDLQLSNYPNNNTAIGFEAGHFAGIGSGNVFLGHRAGGSINSTGQSNKLFIANSDTLTPLVGGDFSLQELMIGGQLGFSIQYPPDGSGVSNGKVFQGTDGALYYKGGSGTVTMLAPN
ncbi:MAG: hypothetical protein ACM3PT_04830 [Deltaproteobacteria bacterium]